MKKVFEYTAIAMILIAVTAPAEVKGCIKGAVVGGVAGHFAGHHGGLGATAGCAIGHHEANKQQKTQQVAPSVTTRQTSSRKLSPARRGTPRRVRLSEVTGGPSE